VTQPLCRWTALSHQAPPFFVREFKSPSAIRILCVSSLFARRHARKALMQAVFRPEVGRSNHPREGANRSRGPPAYFANAQPKPQARPDGRLLRFVYALLDLHICIRVGAVREGVHA
jgi:hypothetical protein